MTQDPRGETPDGSASDEQAGGVTFNPPAPPPIPETLRGSNVPRPEPKPADPSSLAIGLGMASDMLFTTGAGLGLGWAADRWLGSEPWGVLIGLGLGMAAALTRIIQRSQRMASPGRSAPRKSEQDAK